jgi:hypothetical protein
MDQLKHTRDFTYPYRLDDFFHSVFYRRFGLSCQFSPELTKLFNSQKVNDKDLTKKEKIASDMVTLLWLELDEKRPSPGEVDEWNRWWLPDNLVTTIVTEVCRHAG